MYTCTVCGKVKSIELTRALFAAWGDWELNDLEKGASKVPDQIPSVLECHHCYARLSGIVVPTVFND